MVDVEFNLVCAMPTYREGRLASSALASVVEHVDAAFVVEGPSGDVAVPDSCPETWLGGVPGHPWLDYSQGSYGSDAAKRTALVRRVRERFHTKPVWILWLDADEIMVGAEWLRDLIRAQMQVDAAKGTSIVKLDNAPTGGLILRYLEADGSVSREWGRLLRADLIRRYTVSNLIVENVFGLEVRLGRRDHSHVLREPVLPGEPLIVHRPHLRHPYRQQLRLHRSEADALDAAGLVR